MEAFVQLMTEGGPWMYLIVPAAFVANPLAIVTVILAFVLKRGAPSMVLGIVTLCAGGLILAMGGMAWYIGSVQVEQVIGWSTPAEEPELWELGIHLARLPFKVALVGAALPVILGVFAIVRGRRLRGQSEAPAPASSEETGTES